MTPIKAIRGVGIIIIFLLLHMTKKAKPLYDQKEHIFILWCDTTYFARMHRMIIKTVPQSIGLLKFAILGHFSLIWEKTRIWEFTSSNPNTTTRWVIFQQCYKLLNCTDVRRDHKWTNKSPGMAYFKKSVSICSLLPTFTNGMCSYSGTKWPISNVLLKWIVKDIGIKHFSRFQFNYFKPFDNL